MRTASPLAALCAALLLTLSLTARAQLPDLRGVDFLFSGTARLGGSVLGEPQEADLIFADVPFDVTARPGFESDPSQIQVLTSFPAPATFRNAANDRSLTMIGTYNAATGAFSVTGARGLTYIDTGLTDDDLILGNGDAIWFRAASLTLTLNGTVLNDAQGLRIVGSDTLPPTGGPSTNLLLAGVQIRLDDPADTTPDDPVLSVPVISPYGGVTWTAAAVPGPAPLAVMLPGLLAGMAAVRRRAARRK